MLSEIAAKMTNRYVKKGVINAEEKNIYAYGFEVALANSAVMLGIIIISLALRNISYAVLFLFFFSSNRIYSGGYHCRTFSCCLTLTMSIFISVILLHYLTPNHLYRLLSLSLLPLYFIINITLAPIYSSNHTASAEKQWRTKKICRYIIVFYSVVLLIWGVSGVGYYNIMYFAILSLSASSILLIPGRKSHR